MIGARGLMHDTGVGLTSPLFFVGVVENNVDERLEGRVQVRAFGVHGSNREVPTENLPWATLIHGDYDPNGSIPQVNSFVFGFFVDGRDAQQPMILGLIPTQYTLETNPAEQGYGAIPNGDAQRLSQGSNPEDFGEPQNSKLVRGEKTQETYVALQEQNRIKDIEVASNGINEQRQTFEEPAPAYNTEYPFNRVMETYSHVLEMDDTPGSERIMIYHKRNGSYISIDSTGTSVQKSTNDKYEINDVHQHVYVGGKSHVTIVGDSRVYVKGNKVEEIQGNYTQIVHGNHLLSIGGQGNINASEEVQIRSGKLRFESNVEGVNILASKKINLASGELTSIRSNAGMRIQAKESIGMKSIEQKISLDAEESFSIKTNQEYKIESTENISIKTTKEIRIESGEALIGGDSLQIKTHKNLKVESLQKMHFKSGDSILMCGDGPIDISAKGGDLNIQSSSNLNVLCNTGFMESSSDFNIKGSHVKIGGGSQVSLKASTVAADDIVQLANGASADPSSAGEATCADGVVNLPSIPDAPEIPDLAENSELPAPAAKSASTSGYRNSGSTGASGYISSDEYGAANRPPDSCKTNAPNAESYSGERLTRASVNEILSGDEPNQARAEAERFLGRSMDDSEWDNLVAATVAESLPNSPQEQAAIMAVILNRVKDPRYPDTINGVLLQPNQFQAVTGTRANGRAPSRNFTNPDRRQMASTIRGVNEYMGTMDSRWLNFTSNIDAAYGAGTNIGFKNQVANSEGSRVIGGTVFGNVS